MSLGLIGAGGAIVPISNFTQRTKQLALTLNSLPVGWATNLNTAIFYTDSLGNWRMVFNIEGSFTGGSVISLTIGITGVSFLSIQAISGFFGGGGGVGTFQCYANGSSITIDYSGSDASASSAFFSGDVALSANPTTYTTSANMENVVNASAYFPNYTPGNQGLVPATGVPGLTAGSFPTSGNVGEKISMNLVGFTQSSPASTTWYDDSGTLSLTAGNWLIFANVSVFLGSVGGSGYPQISMAIRNGSTVISSLSGNSAPTTGAAGSISLVTTIGVTTTTVIKVSCSWFAFTGSPTVGSLFLVASNNGFESSGAFIAIRVS